MVFCCSYFLFTSGNATPQNPVYCKNLKCGEKVFYVTRKMNFPLTFCRHVFIEETTYKTTHNNSTTFVVLLLLGNEHEVSLGNFRYQTMMVVVYFLVFPLLDRKIFLLSLTRCEKQAKKLIL